MRQLSGDKATIIIYDLHSLRKRKILSSPDGQAEEYVSLAFSPDSKYLAAQSGSPDWTLHYWSWEKSKIMASTKTSNQQNTATLHQVRTEKFFFQYRRTNWYTSATGCVPSVYK